MCAFDFLIKNKKDLLSALLAFDKDPDRYVLIEAEVRYIRSSLQALIGASGSTGSTSAEVQQKANSPKSPAEDSSARIAEQSPFSRRKHRDAFDLVLLASLHVSEQLTYDVGLDMLFQAALALDPASDRPSLTAKLNRWKKDGYVRWIKSSKMYLTPDGFTLYKEKVRACARPGGGLDDVAVALNAVFGISPNFDAVLSAR